VTAPRAFALPRLYSLCTLPAMSNLVILRLDTKTRGRLGKLARAPDRTRAALAAEAMRQYLELNECAVPGTP